MKRIQRQRTKGWRMPEGAVYVGRPSRWGNPFVVGQHAYMWLGATDLDYPIATSREPGEYPHQLRVEIPKDPAVVVRWFRAWYTASMADQPYYGVADLRGKDLVCWCPLDQPCHADVLLELAS
jgi:hypothetical protein